MTAEFTCLAATALVVLLLGWWIVRCAPTSGQRAFGLVGLLVIVSGTAVLGQSGAVADFNCFPPPLVLFLAGLVVVALAIIWSPWGAEMCNGTPLRLLIGMQAFRVLPEVILHRAWQAGLAPVQMTWHGRNFDIVTALSAAVLALTWVHLRRRRAWAWSFTLMGLGLLANIVIVAVLSTPTPFRVFMNEPPNTFVTGFPYIWLPGVHVLTALVLHGLTARKLWRQAQMDY